MRTRLDKLGIPYMPNPSHIVPVMVGDAAKCKWISDILLDRYGIARDEAVFIDDNPANAAAADALGIHGIHFRSPAELRDELRALGFFRVT